MLFINMGHPLTEKLRRQIAVLTAQEIEQEIEIKVQFDHQIDFSGQVRALVDQVGLSSQDWQTRPLLLNPPTLHVIAVTIVAELHGRMGYFPPVLRLRPVPAALPPEFEVAEIINLQAIRDSSRKQR